MEGNTTKRQIGGALAALAALACGFAAWFVYGDITEQRADAVDLARIQQAGTILPVYVDQPSYAPAIMLGVLTATLVALAIGLSQPVRR